MKLTGRGLIAGGAKAQIVPVGTLTAEPALDIWHGDALGVYSGFAANHPDGRSGRRAMRSWPWTRIIAG